MFELTTAEFEHAAVGVQGVARELHPLAHYRDVTPETKNKKFSDQDFFLRTQTACMNNCLGTKFLCF